MKARHAFMAFLLIVVALLSSCEQGQSHATLRVNLRKDRSIVPAGYPLEIESYRITGDGPGDESFSIETNKETISLEGLVIGEWSILAEGLNSQKDVLVTGSTTHRLSVTNGSCTIVLEDLTGEGSLEIVLLWDPVRINNEASIELELTPQYGEKETRNLELTSFDTEAGRATYTGSGYASGSYVLSARLFDGSVQIAGFVEAVRIAGDQTSSGEIEFDLDKYPIDPGTLELEDNTGVPVSCIITGIEDTVEADIPITVTIESETDDVSQFIISWYLDGNLIGTGAEVEFTPEVGTHRLDVVASTSKLGTSGSQLILSRYSSSVGVWNGTLIAMAVLLVPLALITMKLKDEGKAVSAETEEIKGAEKTEYGMIILIALTLGLYLIAEHGITNYIIMYGTEYIGISAAAAGLALSLYSAGIMIGRLVLGTIVDKVGAEKMLFISLVGATIIATAAFSLSVLPLLFLVGLAISIVYPTTVSLVRKHAPATLGARATTVAVSAASILDVIFNAVFGKAIDSFGYGSSMPVLCVALGISAILMIFIIPKGRRQR